MLNVFRGTSCYATALNGNLVSITGDGGNAWGFYGNSYKKLAPSLKLWQYYDSNPDNLSEEELIDYYITEFYAHRLANLDIYELIKILSTKFGNNIVLLCHEPPGTVIDKKHFCHRRLLADYIELETGIIIPEISIDINNHIVENDIYDLKPKIKKMIIK